MGMHLSKQNKPWLSWFISAAVKFLLSLIRERGKELTKISHFSTMQMALAPFHLVLKITLWEARLSI